MDADPIPTVRHLAADITDETGDFLQRITLATETASRLTRLGADLVGVFVSEAREAGATWTAIGKHFGVTRQAAQQRFGR